MWSPDREIPLRSPSCTPTTGLSTLGGSIEGDEEVIGEPIALYEALCDKLAVLPMETGPSSFKVDPPSGEVSWADVAMEDSSATLPFLFAVVSFLLAALRLRPPVTLDGMMGFLARLAPFPVVADVTKAPTTEAGRAAGVLTGGDGRGEPANPAL